MGTVSVGFALDEQTAGTFKRLTNSDIAFAVNGRVEASTLPAGYNEQLQTLVGSPGIHVIHLGDAEYVALSRALQLQDTAANMSPAGGPTTSALILRSRTERLQFLNAIHRELAVTAFLAVLAATLVSYGVARTVTRPLAAITDTMREMAATGDLTRKIALSPTTRWEDEDARLLANTFNAMTSDPHPDHTDCPEINSVGVLNQNDSRETGNLVTPRTCGFHDHENPPPTTQAGNQWTGRILIR